VTVSLKTNAARTDCKSVVFSLFGNGNFVQVRGKLEHIKNTRK
jgi:hypothetical protein